MNAITPKRSSRSFRVLSLVLAVLMVAPNGAVLAAPVGGTVVSGSGSISNVTSTHTRIDQASQRLAIDWQSFDIGVDERVQFVQPNAKATALNRIQDGKASQIFGQIDANGRVILQNQHGILFGRTAHIDTGALVATSLSVDLEAFARGDAVLVLAEDSEVAGTIVNQGVINAATGGSVALIGGAVSNEGLITARLGRVDLAAGSEAVLTFDEDNMIGVRVTKELLRNVGAGSAVNNSGDIISDGGIVVLSAAAARQLFDNAINSSGLIQANAAEEREGRIYLTGGEGAGDVRVSGTLLADNANGSGGSIVVTGDNVGLFDGARVSANGTTGGGEVLLGGDYQGANPEVRNATAVYLGENTRVSADATVNGDGGKLIVWSDEVTRAYGALSARGGSEGGNGGFIETSSHGDLEITRTADVTAANGNGGTWLLDPRDITVVSGNADVNTSNSSPFTPTGSGAQVGVDILEAALDGGASIILQSSSLGSSGPGDVIWQSTAILDYNTRGNGSLTVNAVRDILFDGQIIDSVAGGDSLNVTFNANRNLSVGSTAVLQTNGGNVNLQADSNVSLLAAIDAAGGNIDVTAGIANAGSTNQLGSLLTSGGGVITIAGGTGADSFAFADTTFVGSLDGAGGTDTLTGSAQDETFIIDSNGGGTAQETASAGLLTFTGIETLNGSDGGDQYEIRAGGSLSGGIADSGAAGNDLLYGDTVGAPLVETFSLTGVGSGSLANGATTTFSGIDRLDSIGLDDLLIGTSSGDLFRLNPGGLPATQFELVVRDAADTQTLVTATGFRDIDGGAGNDTFELIGPYMTFAPTTLKGGAGDDVLDVSQAVEPPGTGSVFDGGTGGETLGDLFIGPTGDDFYLITGAGAVEIKDTSTPFPYTTALSMQNLERLDGNDGSDEYEFATGGSLSGGIIDSGATGSDLLHGDTLGGPLVETFTLDGVGSGSFDNGTATTFDGIDRLDSIGLDDVLVGTSAGDLFRLNPGGLPATQFELVVRDAADTQTLVTATGFRDVDGGAGNDTFELIGPYMTFAPTTLKGGAGDDVLDVSQAVVPPGTGSVFDGGTGGETLGDLFIGPTGDDFYLITGAGAVEIKDTSTPFPYTTALSMQNLERLDGNDGSDEYEFATGGSLSGGIVDSGATGSDLLHGDTLGAPLVETFSLTGVGSGSFDNGMATTFAGIDRLDSIGLDDVLVGTAQGDLFRLNPGGLPATQFELEVRDAADTQTLITATGFRDVRGAGGDDTFQLIGPYITFAPVTLQGEAGDDTLDVSSALEPLFAGSVFDGGTGGETLGDSYIGETGDETYWVTGAGVVEIKNTKTSPPYPTTLTLQGLELLDGNNGSDVYEIRSGGSLAGGIVDSGASGNDLLHGDTDAGPLVETYTLDGIGSGSFDNGITPITSFAGVDTLESLGLDDVLIGTSLGDLFLLNPGGLPATQFELVVRDAANTQTLVTATGFRGVDGADGDDAFRLIGPYMTFTSTMLKGGAGDDVMDASQAVEPPGAGSVFDGGSGGETLGDLFVGPGGDDFYLITGAGTAEIKDTSTPFPYTTALSMQNLERLDGSDGSDEYEFVAGGMLGSGLAGTGIVDSGTSGIDVLHGDTMGGPLIETFTLDGVGSGSFANGAITGFDGIDTLQSVGLDDVLIGTDQHDHFVFNRMGTNQFELQVLNDLETQTLMTATGFRDIDGGAGFDVFKLNGDYMAFAPVTIKGGDDVDVLTLSATGGRFADGSVFDGGNGSDAVVGSSGADRFVVDTTNGGNLQVLGSSAIQYFSNVELLNGNEGGDVYEIQAAGSLAGLGINDTGNTGTDLLHGDLSGPLAETFTLTGIGSGSFANGQPGNTNFQGVDRLDATGPEDVLVGTAQGDLFWFNPDGSDQFRLDVYDVLTLDPLLQAYGFTQVDGAAGNDQFSAYNGYMTFMPVQLSGGAGDDLLEFSGTDVLPFASDTTFAGGADNDRLTGTFDADEFLLDPLGGNTIQDKTTSIVFSGVETLEGGSGSDHLLGSTGIDAWTYSEATATGGVTNSGDTLSFIGMDVINGNGGSDTLTFTGGAETVTLGNGAFGSVSNLGFENMLNVDTGIGNDTIVINADVGNMYVGNVSTGDGDDQFSFGGGTVSGTLDGGSAGETNGDRIVGSGGSDSVAVGGTETGVFNDATFVDVESLDGAGGVDMLTSSGTNTWDLGGTADVVSGITFTNFDSISGGVAADTFNINGTVGFDLLGNGGDDIFNLNSGGTLAGNAIGGDGDDTFNLLGGVLTGNIDGGSTAETSGDIIVGGSGTETFVVNGSFSGTVNANDFSGIEYLEGGDGDDTFAVTGAGQVSGVDGGAGTDAFGIVGAADLTVNATDIVRLGTGTTNWGGMESLDARAVTGDLTIAAPVTLSGDLALRAADEIIAGGNLLTAGSVTTQANGDTTLLTDTDALSVASNGNVVVDEASGLTAVQLIGNNVTLTTGGAVTDTDSLLDINATGTATLDIGGAIGDSAHFIVMQGAAVDSTSAGAQFLGFSGDVGSLNVDASGNGVSLATTSSTIVVGQNAGDAILATGLDLTFGSFLLDGDNTVGTLSGDVMGDLAFNSVSALTVDGLNSTGGSVAVTVVSGDATIVALDTSGADDDTNDISITAQNGNVIAGTLTAGTLNDIGLTASGSILDATGIVQGGQLALTAGGDIGQISAPLTTDANFITASAGTGDIWIDELNAVALGDIGGTGTIDIAAGGGVVIDGLIATSGTAGDHLAIDSAGGMLMTASGAPTGITQTGGAAIDLAAEGDIVITVIDAGSTGTVDITSRSGSIIVNPNKTFSATSANITGGNVALDAGANIGSVSGFQLVIDTPVLSLTFGGTGVEPLLLQDTDLVFTGDLLPPLSQLLGNLSFDPDLEGLAYLDPAIFTAVGNYTMDEDALELPEDQKVADGLPVDDTAPVVKEEQPATEKEQARASDRPVPLAMN